MQKNPYDLHGYDLKKIFQDRSLDLTEKCTLIALISWLNETGGGNIPTREFAELSGQAVGNIGKQFQSLIGKGTIRGGKRPNVTHKLSWAIDAIAEKYRIDNTAPPVLQECRTAIQTLHAYHERVGPFTVTITIPDGKDDEDSSTTL